MSVSDDVALPFFKTFAELEAALKQHARFLKDKGTGPTPALINWKTVGLAAADLRPLTLKERLSPETQRRILDDPARNRPRRQEVEGDGATKRAVFTDHALPANEAAALVEAAQRVRNNLFHGSKEECWTDSPDDDEPFVKAAHEIATVLLELTRNHDLPNARPGNP
jgi:hypothetical protein